MTIWWDPSNVSQYVRRLYGMDEPIRNVCIYYLVGSFLRTLLILTIRKNYKETIWYARETIWYGWFMWIYYLEGSFLRTLLICYITWYELTNQNAVFAFLCPYMVWRVLKKDPCPRNPIITLLLSATLVSTLTGQCYSPLAWSPRKVVEISFLT